MKPGPYETIIRGALVLTETGLVKQDVALASGLVAALLPGGEGTATETIDATGLHLLPGAIDIHCHVRAPAFPERGTVESETGAAAAGGVTTLLEMPISKPCCNSAERLNVRREHFSGRARINFGLYVAPGDISPAGIASVVEAGAAAFKIFTTPMPPGREDEFSGLTFPGEAEQLAVMIAVAKTGLPLVVHAESEQLLAHFEHNAASLDPADAATHNATRPSICEAVAVAKLLTLNMEAQAKLHIAHVTSALTVEVLRRFAGSSDFSAETCPHYLVCTEDDVARVGVFGKINPPVRKSADQQALWRALADGTINHVTTDHAAFSFAEKNASAHDFLNAPPGAPGLEFLVPVLLDAAAKGRLSLELAAALLSTNAAKRFGLYPAKGRIAAGADADLVLVDLAAQTTIARKTLFTKAREVAHLYEGTSFSGRVERTFVGGRQVFANGNLVGPPTSGQFVGRVPAIAERQHDSHSSRRANP